MFTVAEARKFAVSLIEYGHDTYTWHDVATVSEAVYKLKNSRVEGNRQIGEELNRWLLHHLEVCHSAHTETYL